MSVLPNIVSPFPPRISPYADDAEDEVRRYLHRHSLLRSAEATAYYHASRLGWLTASIYPDATPLRLMLASDWFCAWTVFDDQLEQLPDSCDLASFERVTDTVLGWFRALPLTTPVGNPLQSALVEAWRNLISLPTPPWRARFLRHTEEYLEGCNWEAANRASGIVPELDDYVASRRRFGGIKMAMDLTEFAGSYELPPPVHDSPPVLDLLDALGDITLWGNDIFSATVDAEEGNVSNLIFVLQAKFDCGVDEAVHRATTMIDERLAGLAGIEERLYDWCDNNGFDLQVRRDAARFVEGAHTWISGNLTWSAGNSRYVSARGRVSGDQPNFLLDLV